MAKVKAKTAPRRPHRPVALPAAARMWLIGAALAALVVVLVLFVNRGGGDGGARIEHVHGLGVNPADGTLYVATHNGVFRVPVEDDASRVGDGAQDTMGFTVVGADHFLASGHPAPLQGGPNHLGLIESTDAGATWRTLSLAGEADFHALQHRHDTTYGYNSVTSQFMASSDGTTWEFRSTLKLYDFAVSPTDPELILGTTDAGLVRSADGGRSWAAAGAPPVVLLAWQDPDQLWGITASGEVLGSADGGAAWSSAGQAPGAPAAVAADGGDLYIAIQDEGIFHSRDAGASWDRLYP